MKMKKTTITGLKAALVLAIGLLATGARSQLYGEYNYNNPNYHLCSGNLGVTYPLQPGMVLAGNRLSSTVNHFTISRTSAGGQFSGSSWEFTNEYQIMFDPSGCGSPSSVAGTCYGVSVIETNGAFPVAMGIRYLVAGAFDSGIFYAELDNAGNVLNTWCSQFTAGTFASKPVICESTTTPGEYYIAGFAASQMYAFKYVAGASAPAASAYYNVTAIPRAIVMSPYNGNEIIVVGESSNPGTADDGFMMQLDNNNLNPNIYNIYDVSNVDQGFMSIDISNSTMAGPPGFIIGGYCYFNPTFPGHAWMLRLDMNGNPTGFNSVIASSTDPSAGAVVGVVERLNTSSQYEYYGSVTANNNLIVFKLDFNGNPPGADEYVYGIGSSAQAVGLSKQNVAGWPDEGLQIYADDRNFSNPNDLYFAQACFSGQSGCSSITNIAQVVNVTPNVIGMGISPAGSMSGCYNSGFGITTSGITVSPGPCGSAPYNGPNAVGGSNARHAAATGLQQLPAASKSLEVYPNPASGKISVSFAASAGGNAKIDLFDYLGRKVASVPVAEGTQSAAIDLGSLNIESGIYVVSAKINGAVATQKIIYNKH